VDSSNRPETPPPEAAGSWARWTAAGFEFGAAVLLFFLLGKWLDATWATSPWLTVAGTLTGIAAGTYLLVRQALRDEKAEAERRRE